MVNSLMTETLPTIVGMGVVSQTTETMFGRRGSRSTSRRGGKTRSKSATVIVGTSRSRAGAAKYAEGYRKALKSRGVPYIGRVKVVKSQGGYVAVYLRGR